MYFVSTTQATVAEFGAHRDTLLGYPSRGVHVGGGRHAPMPETWSGTGQAPPGWTATHDVVTRHDTRSEWATEAAATRCSEALNDARAQRLTPAQRATMQTRLASVRAWDRANGQPFQADGR